MNENPNFEPSIYSDCVDLKYNIYNFNLDFSSIESDTKLILSKIKMSPETAKALSKLLSENVASYEELYGTINELTDEIRDKEKKLYEEKHPKNKEEHSENK